MPLNIVLVEPEIAANAGNIARTCACTGTQLHLIQPLGFSTHDPKFKRAGVDYWQMAKVHYYNSFDEFHAVKPGIRLIFTTVQGKINYRKIRYKKGDYIVFGKESHGLSEYILDNYAGFHVRIPMLAHARSLNLSNAVALVLYEALGQLNFPGLT